MMREVKQSFAREGRALAMALAMVAAYIAGGWGVECWQTIVPDLRAWIQNYEAPK